jgi:rRNA-processing protein FCF1
MFILFKDAIIKFCTINKVTFMYILVQKARNRIIRKLTKIPFVQAQSELLYQAAVNKHLVNLPVLSTSDRTLVETIKRDGVVITSLEA